MYWRLKSIPELRDLSPSERRQLWRRGMGDPPRWDNAVRLLMVLVTFVALVLLEVLGEEVAIVPWVRLVLNFVVIILAYSVCFAIVAHRLRPALRELRQSDD